MELSEILDGFSKLVHHFKIFLPIIVHVLYTIIPPYAHLTNTIQNGQLNSQRYKSALSSLLYGHQAFRIKPTSNKAHPPNFIESIRSKQDLPTPTSFVKNFVRNMELITFSWPIWACVIGDARLWLSSCEIAAVVVVFPPGAAQASKTHSSPRNPKPVPLLTGPV